MLEFKSQSLPKDVGVSSIEVMPPNPKRVHALFQNNHATQIIWLKLDTPAALYEGIRLNPLGGFYEITLSNPWLGRVYAIADGATTRLMITEVST